MTEAQMAERIALIKRARPYWPGKGDARTLYGLNFMLNVMEADAETLKAIKTDLAEVEALNSIWAT